MLYHIVRNPEAELEINHKFIHSVKALVKNKVTKRFSSAIDANWQTFFIHEKSRL